MSDLGLTPIEWNLVDRHAIKQGGEYNRYIALKSLDPATGERTLLNTAGYTARMVIRADYDAAPSLICTTANGRIVTGIQTSSGQQFNVLITITAAATSALIDWGYGVYDLKLTDPFAHTTYVFEGRAVLRREVSYG